MFSEVIAEDRVAVPQQIARELVKGKRFSQLLSSPLRGRVAGHIEVNNPTTIMGQYQGIEEMLSTPRSPWQRAYVERVIGYIRRECLDHVIVFHESSLRRTLASYFYYYHRSRTHLSLKKDSPVPRPIEPPGMGPVMAVPQVGGLHHRYERRAA